MKRLGGKNIVWRVLRSNVLFLITVVKQIKDLVQKSKDSPKECIDELFKNVSNKDLTKAIPALAGHNKVELRIKQLVDLTMPFVDNDLGEVSFIEGVL